MAAEEFSKLLTQFKIDLDQDSVDYIRGMLGDLTLTDHDEIRESTETFLVDANINDMTRSAFYKALFSNQLFQGKEERSIKDGPILLSKKPQHAVEQKKVKIKHFFLPEILVLTSIPKITKNSSDEAEDTASSPTPTKRMTLAEKRTLRKNGKTKRNDAAPVAEEEPVIVAISQQSRFHTETIENTNREIDLTGVQISVNQMDLLVDSHLKLKPLTRYGLVGQNGVGKSILMRCLADNLLVGLPQNLNILHISQLEDFDETTTVVEEILSADKKAAIAVREYEGNYRIIQLTIRVICLTFFMLSSSQCCR
jgi:ATP-binding cassette subfamily F protein 3